MSELVWLSATLPLAAAGGLLSGSTLFLILLCLCVGALVWGVTQLVGVNSGGGDRLQQRLGLREAHAAIAPDAALLRPDLHGDWVDSSAAMQQFALRLDLVKPGHTVAGFFLATALLGLVNGAVASWLFGPLPFGPLAGVCGALLPYLSYRRAYAKRQRILVEQLIEALDFIARGLRAGHSLASALHSVSDELAEPIASELRRTYEQHNLGMSLEDALSDTARRMNLEDFNFFVTSVSIQRQTGGDLAEILDNINTMIRGRVRLAQHVQALTAEGRATGYLLTALPIGVFILMYLVNPDYSGMLFTEPLGRFMLFGAIVLQMFGLLIIRKIVNFKV